MENSDDLLSSLYRRGIRLYVQNGQLRVESPRGRLLPEELNAIRAQKDSIMKLLEQAGSSPDVPLGPRDVNYPVPLTDLQLRRWQWIAKQPGGMSKRLSHIAMRVTGVMNLDLLRRSLNAAVQRHESLRTRIVVASGIPVQHIDEPGECLFEVVDLTGMSSQQSEKEALRLVDALVDENVDLSKDPLIAVKVLRLSKFECVVIFALDHMITDAVSNVILQREVFSFYDEAERGRYPSASKLPIQFADYAAWQRRTYGAWQEKYAPYWRGRLANAPQVRIPVGAGLTEQENPVGAHLEISFGNMLVTRLRELAKKEKTLLSIIVLTIYVSVMSSWCRQSDMIVVLASNGRYVPELHDMIGYLATCICLRIEIAREDSFLTLLRKIGNELHTAHEHMPSSFVLDIVPDGSAEIAFNWLPTDWRRPQFEMPKASSLHVQPFPVRSPTLGPPVKFFPYFFDAHDGVIGTLAYRSDLFSLTTVRWFVDNLRLFAEEFLRRPLTRVASVEMAEKAHED